VRGESTLLFLLFCFSSLLSALYSLHHIPFQLVAVHLLFLVYLSSYLAVVSGRDV
jgi:hypothetical protein